jgi:GNAT superfamily N-acetyltransferase
MEQLEPIHAAQIVAALQDLRLESPVYSRVANDPEWVTDNLTRLIEAGAMLGVVSPDKGFMLGSITGTWFDATIQAYEQLLYVYPNHRGGIIAVRLIRAFENLARERGATCIHVGASTGMNDARTLELYAALGYQAQTASMKKELTHV